MRSTMLILVFAIAASGCAGWVVFGHTMGEGRPAEAPPAPVARPTQAAPSAAAVAPTPVAQSTSMAPAATPSPAATALPPSVGSVYVIVSAQAKDQIAADARFDQQKLLAAVEGELRSRRLLVAGDATLGSASATNRRMEITLDGFSTRASSNAVIFGYALGSGELAAKVDLRDAEGRELSGFPIKATARLATRPAEQDDNPLGNLYHRFAVLTADRLAGVQSKPDESDAMPR